MMKYSDYGGPKALYERMIIAILLNDFVLCTIKEPEK